MLDTSVLAFLGLIANAILSFEEDRYGDGKHLWNVKGDDFTEYAKVRLVHPQLTSHPSKPNQSSTH